MSTALPPLGITCPWQLCRYTSSVYLQCKACASRTHLYSVVHAVPCRAVPCRVVPCRAVLCRAVPCRAVPCCAVLCCAVLYPVWPVVYCQQPSKLTLLPLIICGHQTQSDCATLQSQEQTLLLEPSNAYRRAIQYQQLEKLLKADRGNQGFYVQVCINAVMI